MWHWYVKIICPCWRKSKHVALIWSVRFSKLCASEPFPSRRQPLVPSPTNRRMCDAKGNNLLYPFGRCWLHLYSLSSQCFLCFFFRGATSPLKSPCLSRFLHRKNQAEYTATTSQLEPCSGGLCQKVAGERSNSAAISKRNFTQLGEDWAGKGVGIRRS